MGAAQQRVLKFTNISTEQGLSENTVLDIIQDPYGYNWFATENGLTKFDGMNYSVKKEYLFNHAAVTWGIGILAISFSITSILTYTNEEVVTFFTGYPVHS